MSNKKTIPAQRKAEIMNILEERKFISSTDLCTLLHISESTSRRDLEALELLGLLERVHGGAVISQQVLMEPTYQQSRDTNFEEKTAIGAAVAKLISPNDFIFLNNGTTIEIIAQHIANNKELSNITIVTSNYNVIRVLEGSSIKVISIGGMYREASKSFVGPIALDNLERFTASKSFIGVDGIHQKYGCTDTVEQDAEISRKMISQPMGRST